MLSPVRAGSNTNFSSQGQTTVISTASTGRSIVAPAPVDAGDAADLNSAISGKLNILLVAARERMVDALFDVIDAAGRAMKLAREDDESNLDYASRLADTIQRLPASDIDTVEDQLSKQGHNLPLRLIAEALRNPTGPEAARIIAYLELIRYKDPDLAARAVLRSYRQNDASQGADAEPKPEARSTATQPVDQPARPAENTIAAGTGQEQSDDRIALDRPADDGAQATFTSVSEADVAQDPAERQPSTLSPAEGMEAGATRADAKTAPVAPQTVSKPVAPQAAATNPVAHAAAASATTGTKTDPIIPTRWAGIVASMTDEIANIIVTIIREQEMGLLPGQATVDAAAEIDAMLDAAVMNEAAEVRTASQPMMALPAGFEHYRPAPTRPPVMDIGATQTPVSRSSYIAAQPMAPIIDVADTSLQSVAARIQDGVPYVQIPYPFVKEMLKGEKPEATDRRNQEDAREQDGQQARSDQDDMDGEAGDQAEEQKQPRMSEGNVPVMPAGVVADPMYALYQRMAGWD